MADIAAIFHWNLTEMEQLPLSELILWRRRAVLRWQRMQGEKEG